MVAAQEGTALPLGWALQAGQSHHRPQSGAGRLDAGGRPAHLAHRVEGEGLEVSEVTMQKQGKIASKKLNFAAQAGGLLHQDHTWATMRHCRLHLVASAKISA